MLTTSGRRWRTATTVLLAVLVLTGSAVGTDDAFPFGPFLMYAGRQEPDGTVVSTRVEAVDATGRVRVVDQAETGLKRAEVEGQIGRLVADPALLGALSRAHDDLRPDEAPYVEVRIVEAVHQLRDSRPVGGVDERLVARWVRP